MQEAMAPRGGEQQRGEEGGAGPGSGPHGQGMQQSYYKTRLCIKYMQVGAGAGMGCGGVRCMHRSACPMSHAGSCCLLQPWTTAAAVCYYAQQQHLALVLITTCTVQTGYCHKGTNCTFAHGYEDLRQPGAPMSPRMSQVCGAGRCWAWLEWSAKQLSAFGPWQQQQALQLSLEPVP